MNNPYSAYTRAHDLVDESDKRKVLLAVFRALPEKIDLVKVLIAQKKYEMKYKELTKITTALQILDQSLDMSYGEIPKSLSGLYGYLIRRLTEVHATLDPKTLDECKEIITKIGDGFAEAYEKAKKGSSKPASVEASGSVLTKI